MPRSPECEPARILYYLWPFFDTIFWSVFGHDFGPQPGDRNRKTTKPKSENGQAEIGKRPSEFSENAKAKIQKLTFFVSEIGQSFGRKLTKTLAENRPKFWSKIGQGFWQKHGLQASPDAPPRRSNWITLRHVRNTPKPRPWKSVHKNRRSPSSDDVAISFAMMGSPTNKRPATTQFSDRRTLRCVAQADNPSLGKYLFANFIRRGRKDPPEMKQSLTCQFVTIFAKIAKHEKQRSINKHNIRSHYARHKL